MNTPSPEAILKAENLIKTLQSSVVCPRCHTRLDQVDCYCRHCGRPMQPRMGFWYDHGGILLLTLIVGPFSLITVWLSRKLNITAKAAWTVGILLVSTYLIFALYRSYLLIKESFSYIISAGL